MTITLIGHICKDVIHYPDGLQTQGFGGIFFSIATLANLMKHNDIIIPVFGIGKKDYDELIATLRLYPNVDISGIFTFDGNTNEVNLFYSNGSERIECSKYIAEPIPWKRIKAYLKTDMILINMVSGFDIEIETLDEIRMYVREKKVPIYLDIHSLSLGVNEDGKRFRHPVPIWRRWLFMLHAVQMNEQEASGLTLEQYDDNTLAIQTLSLGTSALIITRGSRGYSIFLENSKEFKRIDEEGISINTVVDSTGCGDVFASAYCAYYLRSKDILASARFANKVAGWKAQTYGSKELNMLSQFRII